MRGKMMETDVLDLRAWHDEQVRRIKAHHRRTIWRVLTVLLLLFLVWRQAELGALLELCRDYFGMYGG